MVCLISCGELSAEDLQDPATNDDGPSKLSEQKRQLMESYQNNKSQLNVIFEVIGTPSELDLAHLDSETATILRGLLPKPCQDLGRKYPSSDVHALHLLRTMLNFCPEKRITAAEAVEHPYFNEIKKKGYINSYRHQNAHFASDSEGFSLSEKAAANPIPLNVNIEKISESQEYLKQNVSCLLLVFL